jgi:DNA-binding LacI/PurR family transcriptional regulator
MSAQDGSDSAGRGTGIVTITDVAKHAGVSPSTVSYVLSGKRRISAVTSARVHASIRLLGYHPHAGARSLASNRSSVIALVLPLRQGMHLPVLMRFATAVVTAARSHLHDVLLVTADEGPAGLRRVAAGAMVDGLVLMDVEMQDPRLPLLRQLERPSVLIGLPADPTGLTCVDLDFHRAGVLCVEHLAKHGHTRIALLGAPSVVYDRDTGFAHRTRDGFTEAAARLGLRASAQPCAEDPAAVQQTVTALLTEQPDLTGLVVHNEAAMGYVLDALRSHGRRVPDDMSVVSICPDELAERSMPPLSSVQIPAEDVGLQAVELLMHKLNDQPVPDTTLLAPVLTPRASTGRPPGPAGQAVGPRQRSA